jgi:hypothetical protein
MGEVQKDHKAPIHVVYETAHARGARSWFRHCAISWQVAG